MPHTDETFYKMKCGWTDDPKVAALARFGPVDACLGRYVFAQEIDYARRELTNGLVPGEVLPMLAHPLPADDAMRVAMQLADDGPYGPLCGWDATSNAFRILAYPKWNDTREEVQARKEKASKAARTRWDGSDASSNAPGNARSNAGSTARSNAHPLVDAPARGRVDAEQEQEQEQDNHRPRRNAGAGATPARATEDDDELLTQIIAQIFPMGAITRDQAASYRDRVLAGKRVRDPAAYVIKTIRNDVRAAYREATAATDTSSRQPPNSSALCRRCLQPGHDAEHCPTLEPGTEAHGGEDTARDGGDYARKLMANRERPAAPVASPDGDLHGEALARSQLAAARASRPADLVPADPQAAGPDDAADDQGDDEATEEPWF
jgi:hypothetical protein